MGYWFHPTLIWEGGIESKSLYDRWKVDNKYDPYDDDDLTENQRAFCDTFDISLRCCHNRC